MRRLWLLWVIAGCSAPARPSAPSPTSPSDVVTQPHTVTAPEPAPQDVVAAAVPPPTPCEEDATSSECKCSQGIADSCFRLSEFEMLRGDHDSAIARVLGMCQKGTPQACFLAAKYLTRLHLDNRLGTTSKELQARGVTLYEEKCRAGDHDTCVEYARFLLAGKYVAADMKRGRELVEKACEAKQARACLTLGNMYASGQGVPKDTKRAIALLEQACTASGGAACTALAELLPASDRKRILELLSRACADDDADACGRVGAMTDAGELLMKACELDELNSCVRAGELAMAKEPPRARAAFQRACEGEVHAACVALAPMIATGAGGPRNFGEGVALADKVCKLQTPKAPKPAKAAKAPNACDVAARLRRSPPEVTCSTIEACRPFCDEKLPKACLVIAELELVADPEFGCRNARESYGDACNAGDAAACMKRGNASDTADDAQRWYDLACVAKHPRACVMRDGAGAFHSNPAERKAPMKALDRACRGRDLLACTWFAAAFGFEDMRKARQLWTRACNAGEARACRLLAGHLDMPGGIGIGDGSPQPLDPAIVKAEKRALELLDRGCKLGDTQSCADALAQRGATTEPPPPRCGIDLGWESVVR